MTVPIPESKRRNNDIYNAKCDRISARPVKPCLLYTSDAADE